MTRVFAGNDAVDQTIRRVVDNIHTSRIAQLGYNWAVIVRDPNGKPHCFYSDANFETWRAATDVFLMEVSEAERMSAVDDQKGQSQ